jgi:hypothetical protein
MGLIAYIYESPLGNHSNGGVSAKHKKVCIANVDGPFEPNKKSPGVRLIRRETGNLICVPLIWKANISCSAAHTFALRTAGLAVWCKNYPDTTTRFQSPYTTASNDLHAYGRCPQSCLCNA